MFSRSANLMRWSNDGNSLVGGNMTAVVALHTPAVRGAVDQASEYLRKVFSD
jgi:hypothetical protein